MSFEMWAEKYRPKTLDDMVDQKEIVERLKSFVKSRNVPHCIFAGPPGTGKTTAALCLARDLYGDAYREHLMELNASDERGINVVRETVKTFARARSIGEIPFKIMILDESDNMTADAQQALRRTMERYTETCRFILCANYSGKIIEPIQSRCAPFRFTFLPREEQDKYLKCIAEKENVKLLKEGLDAIFEVCGGDLRKAINTLQAAASLNKPVDQKVVYSIAGRANPADVQKMIETAINGDFLEARKQLRDMIQKYGVAGSDIIRQIHTEIFRVEIPEPWKIKLAAIVGEIDYRLVEGADEEVQLSALLARLVEAGSEIGKKS
ncbi:MAG: replication factor C small subunit [Candidatus Bathyarchaeota archaeon]|jgi:replication factor C small subunit|nr:replication factor C small subunit [Candidatus Bathyarchaeota archaeon A05DMB-5]MDH7557324.1 replication factor C small subunit [Candidatus Bathyarchaeota archaeon]